ncbi:hypothetical protein SAMN05421813_1457 [Daejeonella rubra]|uniref:Uncharacterized protein n=1 Tax=Daejeonella rubra TaxID=990371 RepID=A0A1G9YVS7_9SPHI|nr:hypothetical protein [Daejeonella rubra]SDN12755.1 hypothetical protein SAMN05421813_1457 [Daejeonella rubra]
MKIFKFLAIVMIVGLSLSVQAQKKVKPEKPEKQFTIYERGPYMTKIDVRKELRGTENIVQIDALNVSGGSALIRGEILPGAEISQVLATVGNYNLTRQISKSGRGESIQLMDVIFPVRLRMTISNQILDVEIKEAGFWKIAVGLTQ